MLEDQHSSGELFGRDEMKSRIPRYSGFMPKVRSVFYSRLFLLGLTLMGPFWELYFPSCAQARNDESRLRAWRVEQAQVVPPSARYYAVSAHPSSFLKLYSGTETGLRVSDNAGLSWKSIPIGGKNEEVFAVAVDPSNPDIVFAGRRDGLWKSRDGGLTWSTTAYVNSVPLSIGMSRSQTGIVYLGTARSGAFRSVDGGASWKEVSNGLPEARAGGRPDEIRSVVVDPLDSDSAYLAFRRHGIFRTTDGGKRWQPFNGGLTFLTGGPLLPPKLVYYPEDPKLLYLVYNERLHSHKIKARLFVLSSKDQWLPVEAELPENFLIFDVVIDPGKRTLQFWGKDAVWEIRPPATDAKNQ